MDISINECALCFYGYLCCDVCDSSPDKYEHLIKDYNDAVYNMNSNYYGWNWNE